MKCPVCKKAQYVEFDLHSEQFSEDIVECTICGSMWAINHGATEIVKDTQENSFLEALSESVEGDDYNWVAA